MLWGGQWYKKARSDRQLFERYRMQSVQIIYRVLTSNHGFVNVIHLFTTLKSRSAPHYGRPTVLTENSKALRVTHREGSVATPSWVVLGFLPFPSSHAGCVYRYVPVGRNVRSTCERRDKRSCDSSLVFSHLAMVFIASTDQVIHRSELYNRFHEISLKFHKYSKFIKHSVLFI